MFYLIITALVECDWADWSQLDIRKKQSKMRHDWTLLNVATSLVLLWQCPATIDVVGTQRATATSIDTTLMRRMFVSTVFPGKGATKTPSFYLERASITNHQSPTKVSFGYRVCTMKLPLVDKAVWQKNSFGTSESLNRKFCTLVAIPGVFSFNAGSA